MFTCLRCVPARLPARPDHMHSEAASSAGLLATSFGGHHHFKDLSTHPLTDLFLFWVMMMMSLFVLAETKWESFLFCIRDFRVRCFCTPYLWERTGSVCIIHLYSVFDLACHLFGGLFEDHRTYHRSHPALATSTKLAQSIFRDQNYVSSAIHFVCVYTLCLYTLYT
jgi:hypothetical protein